MPSLGGVESSSGVNIVEGVSELKGWGVSVWATSVGDGVGLEIMGLSMPSSNPQAAHSKRIADNKQHNFIFFIFIFNLLLKTFWYKKMSLFIVYHKSIQ